MAKWAKECKPERYDAYLEKVVVLKKVLSKIKGEELSQGLFIFY